MWLLKSHGMKSQYRSGITTRKLFHSPSNGERGKERERELRGNGWRLRVTRPKKRKIKKNARRDFGSFGSGGKGGGAEYTLG